MVEDGVRQVEWSTKNLLPLSGKLIPEFDRRRNIRDMFSQKPSLPPQKSLTGSEEMEAHRPSPPAPTVGPPLSSGAETGEESGEIGAIPREPAALGIQAPSAGSKRTQQQEATIPLAKRTKSAALQSGSTNAASKGQQIKSAPPPPGGTNGSSKGQQSLKGFFQAKSQTTNSANPAVEPSPPIRVPTGDDGQSGTTTPDDVVRQAERDSVPTTPMGEASAEASRQSWGKLFSKPISPNCEHDEPCKTMVTKKAGVNCGRSFWMCARPLGPSGIKERNTQWRCSTFIWASDWARGSD